MRNNELEKKEQNVKQPVIKKTWNEPVIHLIERDDIEGGNTRVSFIEIGKAATSGMYYVHTPHGIGAVHISDYITSVHS